MIYAHQIMLQGSLQTGMRIKACHVMKNLLEIIHNGNLCTDFASDCWHYAIEMLLILRANMVKKLNENLTKQTRDTRYIFLLLPPYTQNVSETWTLNKDMTSNLTANAFLKPTFSLS